MRTILAAGIVALMVLAAVPPGSSQGANVLYQSTSADDWGLWSASEDPGTAAGQSWHASGTDSDGDGAAVFGGWVDPSSGAEAGYFSAAFGATVLLLEAAIFLESPSIDASGKSVQAIAFDLRGSAEPGFDPFQVRIDTGSGFQTVFTAQGEQFHGSFSRITLPGNALGVSNSAFTIQFVFTPDGSCDSYDALCGGDWEGWYVDNLVVTVSGGGGGPTTTTTTTSTSTQGPVPPLQIDFPATSQSISGVDMLSQGHRNVCINVMEASYNNGAPWSAVTAGFRVGTSTQYELALQDPGQTGHWKACFIPNDSPLSLGQYVIRITSYASPGTAQAERAFNVVGTDDGNPRIFFLPPGDQTINEQQVVQVVPVDRFLRTVAYQTSAMPVPAVLESPYTLGSHAFLEGTQQLTVFARDRAGNAAAESITVTKDSIGPSLGLSLPDGAFVGIDIAMQVNVSDSSPVKLFVVDGEEIQPARWDPGDGPVLFDLMRDETGETDVIIVAIDSVGHRVDRLFTFDVLPVETDMVLDDVLVPDGPHLVGADIPIRTEFHQETAVTDVPVDITVTSSRGGSWTDTVTVPITGPATSIIDLDLAPGPHELTVALSTDPAITELVPGNQTDTVEVEVFAGRITIDGQTFHIRSSRFSLPLAAVDLDTGETHRLSGGTTDGLYRFTVGGETYEWDPSNPIVTVNTDDSEDSPFGFVAALVLLGAVALSRRRD